MKIGEKIKIRRLELGWSQQQLADKMGYTSKSTIARIENGNNDVAQRNIVKFAEVLGVSIAYLMDWDESVDYIATIHDPDREELQVLIEAATPSQMAQLLQIAKVIIKR